MLSRWEPELFDTGAVGGNGNRTHDAQKIGVRRTLKEELHPRVSLNMLVPVAIIGAYSGFVNGATRLM